MNRSNRELRNIYATQYAIATGNQQALQKQIQKERAYNEANRKPKKTFRHWLKKKLAQLNNIDFFAIKGYD